MSEKAAATYHGADIVDRLDVTAPHSEDGGLLREAATTIRDLRAQLETRDPIEMSDELVECVADWLAYFRVKLSNPKADHPIMGYRRFSQEQRAYLAGTQHANARALLDALTTGARP